MVAAVVERASGWRVHRFEVWSGELVCRVEALRMRDSLMLWVGAGAGAPLLGDVALGVTGGDGVALATTLVETAGGEAAALARRLTAALSRPVYVCSSLSPDRFTAPLLERALVAEIKSRPECF